MHGLQRVHQHAGDVAARAQYVQRILVHVLERVGLSRARRVADAWLHVAPPAVVRAAEPHQVRAPRVIARQPHRLHDRLRARHVERHLVQPGQLAQTPDVVGGRDVVAAQRGSELARAGAAPLHALLVEVVAEHVDAVRAGQVVEHVVVEVGQRDARRRLVERSHAQMLAYEPAVLERHPVGARELQVGQAGRRVVGELARLREALLVQPGQPHEAGAAPIRDFGGGVVGTKDPRVVIVVERHVPRDPGADPGVAPQRRVLRARQLQPHLQLVQRRDKQRPAHQIGNQLCSHWPPAFMS